MSLTVLITGFGPFPGAPVNPTAALARALARRRRPAFALISRHAHVFPTSYAAVDRDLPALIARHRPDIVLMFGLAGRTKALRVELRATGRPSPLFVDVDGALPPMPIIDGVAVRRTRTSPHRLSAALRNARIPARLSHDAGRYLCNYVYWQALAAADRENRVPLVQFVHVPPLRRASLPRRRRRNPALSAGDLLRGGESILLALITAARARR
jgi:pyroglutamyl-peptidase